MQVQNHPVNGNQSAVAVRYIGSDRGDGVGQALRVHSNMSLDAGHLFANVTSFLFCAIGVLDALRINNDEAGCGLAPQFLAGLANRFLQGSLQCGDSLLIGFSPLGEIRIHREACATGSRS